MWKIISFGCKTDTKEQAEKWIKGVTSYIFASTIMGALYATVLSMETGRDGILLIYCLGLLFFYLIFFFLIFDVEILEDDVDK